MKILLSNVILVGGILPCSSVPERIQSMATNFTHIHKKFIVEILAILHLVHFRL